MVVDVALHWLSSRGIEGPGPRKVKRGIGKPPSRGHSSVVSLFILDCIFKQDGSQKRRFIRSIFF